MPDDRSAVAMQVIGDAELVERCELLCEGFAAQAPVALQISARPEKGLVRRNAGPSALGKFTLALPPTRHERVRRAGAYEQMMRSGSSDPSILRLPA